MRQPLLDAGVEIAAPTKRGKLLHQTYNEWIKTQPNNGVRFSLKPTDYVNLNELRQIYDESRANGTYMKAPNGKPTKLNQIQWLQVRTKAFKKWFGDWENDPENASKVVNENGEPLPVYHGSRTGGNFTEFNGTTFHNNDYETADMFKREADYTILINGEEYTLDNYQAENLAYFLTNGDYEASEIVDWGDLKNVLDDVSDERKEEYQGLLFDNIGVDVNDIETISLRPNDMYTDFLNIRNPLVVDFGGKIWGDGDTVENHFKKAREKGHDGLIVSNIIEGGYTGELRNGSEVQPSTDYVTFSPNQIKSATDNVGSFDSNNNDIRFSRLPKAPEDNEATRKLQELWDSIEQSATPETTNTPHTTRKATEILQDLAGHYTWYESNTISEEERKIWKGIITHRGRSQKKAEKEGREWREEEFFDKLDEDKKAVYEKVLRIRNQFDIDRADRIRRAEDAVLSDVRQTLAGKDLKAAIKQAEKEKGSPLTPEEIEEIKTTTAVNMRNEKKRNKLFDALYSSIATFDMMMRKLGRFAPNGKGDAWKYFMGNWDKARNQELSRMTGIAQALNIKANELGFKNFNKLQKQAKDFGLEIQFTNTGAKPLPINMSQVMMIYAWSKQGEAADIRFELAHISQESVEACVAKMNEYPELKAFVDWVQEDMLPALRNDYMSKLPYKERWRLMDIDNYFPFRAADVEYVTAQESKAGTEETMSRETTDGGVILITPNALHDRAAESAFGLDATFFSLLANHIHSMEKFYNYGELTEDLQQVFGKNKDIRNRIKMIDGNTLRDIERANAILVGQASMGDNYNTFDSFASTIFRNSIKAKIAFKPFTALKQLESMLIIIRYVPECRTAALKNVTRLFDNVRWAQENMPQMYERFVSGSAGNELIELANNNKYNTKDGDSKFLEALSNNKKELKDWAMWLNKRMDAIACAYIARSVYEGVYKKCKQQGLSEEECKDRALFAADDAVNSTQQSQESAYLSPIQVDRSALSVIVRAYQNSPYSWGRKFHQYVREMSKDDSEMITHLTQQYSSDGLSDEEAEEKAKQEVNRNKLKATLKMLALYASCVGWSLMNTMPEAGAKAVEAMQYDDDDDKEAKQLADEEADKASNNAKIEAAFNGLLSMLSQGYAGTSFFTNGFANFCNEMYRAYSEEDENTFFDNITAASFNTILQNDLGYAVVDGVRAYKTDDGTRMLMSAVKLGSVLGVGIDADMFANMIGGIYYACEKDKMNEVDIAYVISEIAAMPKSVRDELVVALRVYDGTPEDIETRVYRMMTYVMQKRHKGVWSKLTTDEISELTNRISDEDVIRPELGQTDKERRENRRYTKKEIQSLVSQIEQILGIEKFGSSGLTEERLLRKFLNQSKLELNKVINASEDGKETIDELLPLNFEFNSFYRDPDAYEWQIQSDEAKSDSEIKRSNNIKTNNKTKRK